MTKIKITKGSANVFEDLGFALQPKLASSQKVKQTPNWPSPWP
jgi:hypothetical protein